MPSLLGSSQCPLPRTSRGWPLRAAVSNLCFRNLHWEKKRQQDTFKGNGGDLVEDRNSFQGKGRVAIIELHMSMVPG